MTVVAFDSLRPSAIFNLAGATTMVVDDSSFSTELTIGALMGFGIKVKYVCHSADEAIDLLTQHNIDLLLVDCEMPGKDGYELVRWLRREGGDPNSYAPVIMTAGHVRRSRVAAARDCGANFLVTKPFSASTLLERILWVARDQRPFLEVGDYFGPDRRIREQAPAEERRVDRIRLAEMQAMGAQTLEVEA
jgi:CheY-like chemotaxis protein